MRAQLLREIRFHIVERKQLFVHGKGRVTRSMLKRDGMWIPVRWHMRYWYVTHELAVTLGVAVECECMRDCSVSDSTLPSSGLGRRRTE